MAKEKTLDQHVTEYKELVVKHHDSKKVLDEKQTELESKLADLKAELEQQQHAALLDLSDDSLKKDAQIKKEIADTEMLLATVKDRKQKLVFPVEINAKRDAIFEEVKREAVQEYDDRLPALLEEISAAKAAYISKLIEYHDLKHGVYKKIKDTCAEVGKTNLETIDLPAVAEVDWQNRSHHTASGHKYIVSEFDVEQALTQGKIDTFFTR
ncbi:hypothetical protein [Heyndrickxia ginsengihumi]|uniref:hypothetical protein n=1 Tax=Heyndrickxia ginsengihumi TaxID=363870 RepID=UPI003D1DB294